MPIILTIVGILLLLYILLLCPMIITADLCGDPRVFLKFLFFKFPIYPRPEKKKKAKPKSRQSQTGDKKKEKKTPSHGISYYVDKYGELVKSLVASAGKLLPHLTVNTLDISVTVADEDAAKTAVEYGGVCAVLYPMVSLLESNVEVKECSIGINPDFDAKTPNGRLYADVRIRTFHVISAVFGLLSQLIKFSSK